ncbi:lipoprotein, NLP/P60 family [hydrothermal vent metagenome]|uniref:Lipoprotein, NLP/P60 family n=1 Tax=hydrothermal vent metagenome TaxID=652676 RepID=A0A1W1CGG0_9ZZZZ
MKKYILLSIIALLLNSCQEVSEHKPLLIDTKEKQPIIIVNQNRHLNIPEFWIDKIENPDKLIMSPKKIKEFNDKVAYVQKKFTYFRDTNRYYSSSWVKNSIEKMFNNIETKGRYFADGNRILRNFYSKIKNEMNLNSLPTNRVKSRYALTINYTNQKIIPTDLELLKKKNQIYFDRNQNSALDIATPITILHSTDNGEWHYGIGPTSSGWIKDKNIAFGEKKEIEEYLDSKNFIITTEAKSAVMVAGRYYDYLRMGVRLPSLLTIDDMTMVLIPSRDQEGRLILKNATIKTSNTHKGYLPYTPKTILTQAFKFLHAPYGWGGSYGEQDCSKFLQEIYATVGINIPRNSSSQTLVGSQHIELSNLKEESKRNLIRGTTIGATILHLKGHIMLYLGEYKGEPYIIHTVWGEGKRHFALGRTAITALEFNDYIDKIDRATLIKNQD